MSTRGTATSSAAPSRRARRRAQLAVALWHVVRREGIGGATVRAVAAEAGTTPGALRHYFATQDELIAFALGAVVDRAVGRVQALPQTDPAQLGLAILEQVLPLDDDRREEMAVYLEVAARAHANPALRPIRDRAQSATREAVAAGVALLKRGCALGPDADVEREADILFPLIDGLALHGTQFPLRYPADHLQQVLRRYLASR